MIKNLTRIEHIVEGRIFHLLFDQDSPIEHILQSLHQFLGIITSIHKNILDQKAAEAAKAPVEVPQSPEKV